MAKIEEITVSFGRTIQTAPYESTRFDVTLRAVVTSNEIDKEHDDLVIKAKAFINNQISDFLTNQEQAKEEHITMRRQRR